MVNVMKNTKSERMPIGYHWDVDLGWVLIWWSFLATVLGIFIALAYASVQNNRGNVARDNYYAERCKVVSKEHQESNFTSYTYQCKQDGQK